jgi:hypothetical protein
LIAQRDGERGERLLYGVFRVRARAEHAGADREYAGAVTFVEHRERRLVTRSEPLCQRRV